MCRISGCRDGSEPRNAQGNTSLFGSELEMLGSFGTADFSDRLDMLTMPALGSVLFPEWSCLRLGSHSRFFVSLVPAIPVEHPASECKTGFATDA